MGSRIYINHRINYVYFFFYCHGMYKTYSKCVLSNRAYEFLHRENSTIQEQAHFKAACYETEVSEQVYSIVLLYTAQVRRCSQTVRFWHIAVSVDIRIVLT